MNENNTTQKLPWSLRNKERLKIYNQQYREKNKKKLLAKEKQYYIANKESILLKNKVKYHSNKEQYAIYREKNKNKITATRQKSYAKNKNNYLNYQKEYYIKNISLLKNKAKAYRQKNRETVLAGQRAWREKNRHVLREKDKLNRQKNREKILARNRISWSSRRKNSPYYKIESALRNRIYSALRSQKTLKNNKTEELIGCTVDECKKYIESLWLPGMSWDNYTLKGWHIDHIKPVNTFNLLDIEQQKACFHYTNLRPLWALDNWKRPKNGSDILLSR